MSTATARRCRTTGLPIRTWADGWGVWHVAVPRGTAHPEGAARVALREELTARVNNVRPSIYGYPIRVPEYDTSNHIVFREGN